MVYSVEQNVFIVRSYYRSGRLQEDGSWSYDINTCKEEYLQRFPDLDIQEESLIRHIQRVVDRFETTGSVKKGKSSGRPRVTDEAVEDIRERMEQSPKKSLRKLSLQSGIPISTCQKVLKKVLHKHPYRITSVQELREADLPLRVQYCNWFQNNINNDNLLDLTFFSDEAWFHLSGYMNSQNMRIWSSENPHEFIETPLHAVKVGVWLAISRRRIIGPIFFHDTITSERYREQILEPFINQLHDDELTRGFFPTRRRNSSHYSRKLGISATVLR